VKHSRPDRISPEQAVTLDGLFHQRARNSPNAVAYRHFDDHSEDWQDLTWAQMVREITRWQAALQRENLQPGDRVAVMLKNCPAWVMFDQAALGLGLVTVPLYTADRPDNVLHVLEEAGVRLLLINSAEHWHPIREACSELGGLTRVVTMRTPPEGDDDERLRGIDEWLPQQGGSFVHRLTDPERLATIIYTSGTTGRSKGVMLSHRNLLRNAWDSLQTFDVLPDDIFLSFLPLSHALERTVGYYLPIMAGATVGFARSFQQLQDDLIAVRPTLLASVPRIYERIYAGTRSKLEKGSPAARHLFKLAVDVGYSRFEHAQRRACWRPAHLLWPLLKRLVADKLMQRLGGRLRMALSGGAALSPEVSRVFIGLGLPILQGYGLTETSPVISVNCLHHNKPASVGPPIPGVEVRLGDSDALLVRSPGVMQGYWSNEQATRAMFTTDGWLNTGDTARIDETGHIYITGRIKDIIVLSNGEKVPPGDLEAAILRDPLFDQVMVLGEGKPYLGIFAVVNREQWETAARERGLPGTWPEALDAQQTRAFALTRIARQMKEFPGYTRIRRAALMREPWTVENGLLTPTLKLKRAKVLERFQQDYDKLYEGYSQ
jgi:long-chain acyl-CoA synthetase